MTPDQLQKHSIKIMEAINQGEPMHDISAVVNQAIWNATQEQAYITAFKCSEACGKEGFHEAGAICNQMALR